VINFGAISLTHKSFNINELGGIIPSSCSDKEQQKALLNTIKKEMGFSELFFLNTCNRLLFVFYSDNLVDTTLAQKVLSTFNPSIDSERVKYYADSAELMHGEQVVRHLFEVSSSVDSLVVGEHEILGQVKNAFEFCHREKLSGDCLRILMQSTIVNAKEVYTKTKIGENAVSVVSLAVEKLTHIVSDKNSRVAFVGAGQTNSIAGKLLLKKGFSNFKVFNRGQENAERLAKKLNCDSFDLPALDTELSDVDVLFCCTGASAPIIKESHLSNVDKNLIIIDLGVPSDISSEVLELEKVQYISIEDLRKISEQNLILREKEVAKVHTMIDKNVEDFDLKFRHRSIERAMASIPVKVKEIKHRALDKVFNKEIDDLDENAKSTLLKVVDYLEKKYIGIPVSIAKSALESEIENLK